MSFPETQSLQLTSLSVCISMYLVLKGQLYSSDLFEANLSPQFAASFIIVFYLLYDLTVKNIYEKYFVRNIRPIYAITADKHH